MNLITLTVVSLLFGAGTFLLLQRSLAKVIIGLGLISHGANLFIMLSSTASGGPPVLSEGVDAAAQFTGNFGDAANAENHQHDESDQ